MKCAELISRNSQELSYNLGVERFELAGKFDRCDKISKIIERYLGILLVVVLLRANPSRYEVVPDAVGQCEKIIASRSDIAIFRQSIVEVSVEGLLKIRYILDIDNAAH